ncbi:MAG: phage head closure protein [Halomonas sp.]
MDIGQLRHPVAIRSKTLTQDPNTGAMESTWGTIGQDWAAITGVSGKEFIAASAEQAQTTYRLTMRYRPDLTTSMRLENDGTTYAIKAILPDNQRRFMTCMCEVMA